jgi:hypothetical protein
MTIVATPATAEPARARLSCRLPEAAGDQREEPVQEALVLGACSLPTRRRRSRSALYDVELRMRGASACCAIGQTGTVMGSGVVLQNRPATSFQDQAAERALDVDTSA